ncbi:hypothetical protein EO087_04205 [Dyella sp. M7H15-1]|uniref:hypothetical protein n=1 Tax=Dyella sp. M7H15-1 TaxID=2501295 RepID=UPI001005031D|nr:hypothetical protein [Dyella sp. M7H15-1]QAU23285.1 hypothetical protein EO087_04205 [Dyella sp. M7H15-1]
MQALLRKSMSIYTLAREAGARKVRRGRFELMRLSRPGERLDASMQREMLFAFAKETDLIYQADTSFHWLSRKDYFAGIEDLWLVFLDRELVGFTGIRLFYGADEKIVYIDNMNIRSIPLLVADRHTLGSMLVHEILRANYPRSVPPMSVVFRTQNPSVYRLAQAILPPAVYPRMDPSTVRDEERCRRVLGFMAQTLSPGKVFECDVSVIRRAYGGHIYGRPMSSPISIKPVLANFWKEHVSLENGDAVLIAVCPTHPEVRGLVDTYARTLIRWMRRVRGPRI